MKQFKNNKITLYNDDCLNVLRTLGDHSIDSIVTDPPAGISFMGKGWDDDKGGRDNWISWMQEIATEALRVAKPGSHALVWALPRTSHWTATAWENAGWEVRDIVNHIFGQGFPKSTDLSKSIDKKFGAEREAKPRVRVDGKPTGKCGATFNACDVSIDYPDSITDKAKQWEGWGTALKPAHENWILFRKPVEGSITNNVLEYGVGGLNIDDCRIGTNGATKRSHQAAYPKTEDGREDRSKHWARTGHSVASLPSGRFPANVMTDGSDEVVSQFPDTGKSIGGRIGNAGGGTVDNIPTGAFTKGDPGYGDLGSAARFFYCSKASKTDRAGSKHPTVKSQNLMRYLCRLITPPNGVVLDMFGGSGSTCEAALSEGFKCIIIEKETDYANDIENRINSIPSDLSDLF